MLFEFSVLLRCPSPLKRTKRHSKLRSSTATTSMTRWSFPLHCKLDARLSTPKIFKMARQLMDNSPFEIPSLDHPASRQSKSFSILPCSDTASRTKLVYLFGRIISAQRTGGSNLYLSLSKVRLGGICLGLPAAKAG